MTIASSLFSGLRLPAFGRSTKDTLPFPVSKRPLDTAEARQSTPPSLPLPVAISSSGTSSETATNVANIADIDQRDHETVVNEKIDVEAQQYEVKPPPKIPRLARLPTWISFWLGYRKVTPPPEKNYVVWIWSFVGSFACISILQALFGNTKVFVERGVPSIGATAILLYGAIESPLSQPRPVIGGHLVGSLTGICITKLFYLLPTQERFDELNWLAGSLCCALSLVFMQMTGTMHPPAGATALLAAVSPDIRNIGWLYVPVVLLASSIALVIALICNNMQRRYPTYWWTPPPTTAPSFFATLPLTRTLTKTWTWTSTRSRKFASSTHSFRSRKRNGKKSRSTSVPVTHEDKDWHYSIKNYSKIFGNGHNPSGSRESSRSRHGGTVRSSRNVQGSAMPSAAASHAGSQAATPMTVSPSASAAVSRRPSTDDLHVAFHVEPLHRELSLSSHSPRHHHHHQNNHNISYLRYLAMKREGTWSPGHATPGYTTPPSHAEPARISRSASVDNNLHTRGRPPTILRTSSSGPWSASASTPGSPRGIMKRTEPDPEVDSKTHAEQLSQAVTSALLEREAQEKMQAAVGGAQAEEDGPWEDIDEEAEVDLGKDGLEIITRKASLSGKPADEIV